MFDTGVDFVPFIPQVLRDSPNSPLYYLVLYRRWYIATMADPYYDMDTPGHFFDFFVYIELLIQFPFAVYLTHRLLTQKPLDGAGELATVVYGATTSLCTATVCHDMWHLGPEIVDQGSKRVLLAAYVPYAIIRTCNLSSSRYYN